MESAALQSARGRHLLGLAGPPGPRAALAAG